MRDMALQACSQVKSSQVGGCARKSATQWNFENDETWKQGCIFEVANLKFHVRLTPSDIVHRPACLTTVGKNEVKYYDYTARESRQR